MGAADRSRAITTGLYASAIINQSELVGNPYLHLSKLVLPVFWQNVFLISLISIVMSTIDSYSFLSAMTFGYAASNNKKNYNLDMIKSGLIITGISSFILCYYFENAINMWYVFGSIAASTLLVPFIILLYYNKYQFIKSKLIIVVPLTVSILWFVLGSPLNIDPLYPGIFISIILNYFYTKSLHYWE